MNSRQLQYVVTLAEEKNFTKAAKRLIIAQPSLSQYISKLENGTRNPSVSLLKRLAEGMGMVLKIEFIPKQKV